MSRTIEMAKAGNILDRWSFGLLNATDFAYRLEHRILPTLRSGFVVLANRYICTAFARDYVRGVDRRWIRDVLGFSLIPDLVCYLQIKVETLALRVIGTTGMNYLRICHESQAWERSLREFQEIPITMIKEFDKTAIEFWFNIVDARKSPEKIQVEYILPVLQKHMPTVSTETSPP